MSSFSNGNYVPSGMDFSDWVEYLEEKRDAEKFALIDKEFEEFFGEFLDLEPEEEEEEFKLSLPEEHFAKLKVLSDSVSQEPEQTKKKSPKRSFDMER